MNYELKNIDNIELFSTEKPRSIKLRQLSFTNVSSKWNFVSPTVTENVVSVDDTKDSNDEIQKNKLPISIGNLDDKIVLIDLTGDIFQSIKRRVLAVSSEMYKNISDNVIKAFANNDNQMDTVSEEINDEEIRQAVKDAFDQIDFSVPDKDDVVITPEEVNDTISDVNNEVDFSYDNSDVKIPDISDFESDNNENDSIDVSDDNTKSLFSFEDINFDKIESSQDEPDSQDIVGSNEVDQDSYVDVESDNLDNILSEINELKAQKDEQDKKTEDAINLAIKKEKEKEKAKLDFEKYKTTIKEELDKSKKAEEENLAKAKKAEEFTTALSDVMNSGNSIKNSFVTEN